MDAIQPAPPAPPERWQGKRQAPQLKARAGDEDKAEQTAAEERPRGPRGVGRLDILA